jgi:hypothetical protein
MPRESEHVHVRAPSLASSGYQWLPDWLPASSNSWIVSPGGPWFSLPGGMPVLMVLLYCCEISIADRSPVGSRERPSVHLSLRCTPT